MALSVEAVVPYDQRRKDDNDDKKVRIDYLNLSGDNDCFPFVLLRNKLTALIIEKDSSCRMMETSFLQYFGVETQAVDNCQAAANLIACDTNFDIIFIDRHLSVINGIEATRCIRRMGVYRKIVGMTVNESEEERQEFLEAGVDEVIDKDLDIDVVARILMEVDAQLWYIPSWII